MRSPGDRALTLSHRRPPSGQHLSSARNPEVVGDVRACTCGRLAAPLRSLLPRTRTQELEGAHFSTGEHATPDFCRAQSQLSWGHRGVMGPLQGVPGAAGPGLGGMRSPRAGWPLPGWLASDCARLALLRVCLLLSSQRLLLTASHKRDASPAPVRMCLGFKASWLALELENVQAL